ncbi:hypothetical protein [Methylobacterium nodulans]|uniref:Uncharacterized protein n=1 Tax=Methylobacterium nodulans (strain LMG 21967 / CNCM I-2342 / ORS 2060) TaxID=460265 RepID=B8ICV9_METNO|nr:hypothetical protein [Methylobacterium nodulans]ACL57520.1 hypothetical protein Mnod_2556 [Methylobacterium nodulans ORS 2060]
MLIEVEANPVCQTVLLQVQRIFCRCVRTGKVPEVFGDQAPKAKLPAVTVVDPTASNAWAEYAAVFARTCAVHAKHESARAVLKALAPEDAKEAAGHGLCTQALPGGHDQLRVRGAGRPACACPVAPSVSSPAR